MRCIVVYGMTAAIKPIPNESAAGQGRAGTLAKAAGSLCAACLSKSKEKCRAHKQSTFRALTDGKNAGGSPLCEKPKAYARMLTAPQEGKERL